jgi:16S rRNA (adenine1518-N6/adenine1519-N6)-dimethyltransferase
VNIPRPARSSEPAVGAPTSLAQETQAILRTYHIRPREQLGQNFLIDREVLGSIVRAADLRPGQQVLEIGPGIGTLTLELAAAQAQVVAIELDTRMARITSARATGFSNVRVHEGNVLHTNLEDLLDGRKEFSVVANIPYYITGPILRLFLQGPLRPRTLVLMVQREVGERLAARAGKMSALSVFAQVHASVEVVRHVPASSFLPPPEVASSVIRLRVHETPPVPAAELPYLLAVVRAGFSAKRKMLHNALDRGLPNSGAFIDRALERVGIERTRRAETLDIGEWRALALALREDQNHVPKNTRLTNDRRLP